MREIEYSIVVPVYESSKSVEKLVQRVCSVMEEEVKQSFEIVLVDDGSTSPETRATLESLCSKFANVMAVILMRNYGKSGAVMCGFEHAQGKWIITLDDDLQHLPEHISQLLEHQAHDVVVANYVKKNHSLLTRITSNLKSKFDLYVLGLPCKMSPMKLIRADIVEKMLQIMGSKPFIPALLSFTTKDIIAVPLEHGISEHGRSRYTHFLRLSQFIDLLIGNSAILLRSFGFIGVVVSLTGFAIATWMILESVLYDYDLIGIGGLMVTILIFGGLILIGLSLVGEYLYRILEVTNRKPPYMIRTVINGEDSL